MSTQKKTQAGQYLFQLCFDSPLNFRKNLYFNYDGIDFKLIKGTQKYQDILCSIVNVESSCPKDFEAEGKRVETTALRFLNCLSWEKRVGITNTPAGGAGWSKERGGLSSITRRICPRTPRAFRNRHEPQIMRLPNISHNEHAAVALSLFREGTASNSLYYRFLCYWKILELSSVALRANKKKPRRPIDWINKTVAQNKWILDHTHVCESALATKTIGAYLKAECRNAIAHVMPKHKLPLDSRESTSKIYAAVIVVEYLADIFIRTELSLDESNTKDENCLYLRKKQGKVIPEFVPAQAYSNHTIVDNS
jgi:hypothetical protein